ncbi:MAG TPA: DinB family protein [Spirochaetales bacterium]|nr:DinB family protein [Spirochaetales bacterium]HRY55964.1 DinB family protein [Spirochaetia bacterium]HRZ63916.1 DinB family protein [Spirochaetia bacterium]
MKEVLSMYARYGKRADESVMALLDGLSPEARNEDRKSYYKSLTGLASHLAGGALYFAGLFRAALPAAAAALQAGEGPAPGEGGQLDAAGWAELKARWAAADRAIVELVAALSEAELAAPVKLDWYGGKPDSVPMCFLLHQLYVHGIHHRGQISQILDSMGVEHDFSGIDLEFLPKA